MRLKRLTLLTVVCLLTSLLAACTTPALEPTPTSTPIPTPTSTPIPLDDWIEEGNALLRQSDFAGARTAYERVIEVQDDYAPAYISMSLAYYWPTGFANEALTYAEKAVELAPESTEAYAVLALAQMEQENPDEAVAAAERAVEIDEESGFAQSVLTRAYLYDRQYEPAKAAAEQAVALAPDLAEAYYALSLFYYETADFARSYAACERAIAMEPQFVPWRMAMANYHREAKDYDQAMAVLDQVLEIAPDYVSAILGKAYVHIERRQYEEAEAQIEHALELAPDTPNPYIAWGHLYLAQDEPDEAMEKFRKALEYDENDWWAQLGIGATYRLQNECDSATRHYQEIADQQPRFADVPIGLGLAKLCEQDLNKALEYFRKAAELEPYNAAAQIGLGHAYSMQGRWEEAVEAYVQALRLSPSGADVHSYLAYNYQMQGDTDPTRAEYELALALYPDLVEAYVGLGDLLLQEREIEEARVYAERAATLDVKDQVAKQTLGAALVMLGEAEEGAEALEQVVEEEPENIYAHFYLGLAYRDLGKYTQAKKELETYLALCYDCQNQQQVETQITFLDQGYLITADKAISDLEDILSGTDSNIELEETEDEGRTLVVTLDIPAGQEQQEMAMLMGGIAGVSAYIVPRVDPPIDNGVLIRFNEWGRPKFTTQIALVDMQQYADGITSAIEFVSSMKFSHLIADEGASVREIQADVAEIRELDPQVTVPYEFWSQDDLRAYLVESIDEEEEHGEFQTDETILTLLGLIEPDLDLENLIIDLYSEQIAGFYDTDEDTFYVLEDDEQTASDQMTIAHEYVHALQDQHFGLDVLDEEDALNADQRNAFDALVEGDATLAALLYADEYIGLFDQLGSVSSAASLDSEVFDASPSFIRETHIFPYADGLNFVSALYERGGWDAVNEAYNNPPQSTEQILHPERYREGDEPQDVSLSGLVADLGDGWTEVDRDVLGELGLRLILSEYVGPAAAAMAADGWGGDQYVLLENDEGAYVLVIQTLWDDQDEADEFWMIYQVYMRHRAEYIEDVDELIGAVSSHYWTSEEEYVFATQKEQSVTIVVGSAGDAVEQVGAALADD